MGDYAHTDSVLYIIVYMCNLNGYASFAIHLRLRFSIFRVDSIRGCELEENERKTVKSTKRLITCGWKLLGKLLQRPERVTVHLYELCMVLHILTWLELYTYASNVECGVMDRILVYGYWCNWDNLKEVFTLLRT